MTGYLWTPGGRKEVEEIRVGTVGGMRTVERAYVGTAQGNKQWYQRAGSITLSASPASHTAINTTWNSPGAGYSFNLYRGATLIYSGTNGWYVDNGLAASTTYSYRVDGVKNGAVQRASSSVSATTNAAPPPPPPPPPQPTEVSRVWETACWTAASYHGNRGVRSDAQGRLYTGYISESAWRGNQKSTWNFGFPADWTSRVSVQYVHMKVRMYHTWSNPTAIGVVLHHNSGQGYGSTGRFASFNASANGNADAWLGNVGGDGFIDITGYRVPGSFNNRNWTVAEEFAWGGATGLGLWHENATNGAHYGYAWGPGSTNDSRFWPSIRIGYRVRV